MAESGSSVSVSAARWLVAVIASVVLCFTVASAVGEYLESAIGERANDITADAMPSVQLLTTVQREVQQIDLDMDRYAAAPVEQRPEHRARIIATRKDVAASFASYAALPSLADEPLLQADLRTSLADLDDAVADYFSDGQPRSLARVHVQLDLAEEAIARSVSFNAAQGQRLGTEIQHIRSETRGIVELLDVASVVLAIGACYLAVRQLRRAARDQKAEREARERRAAELAVQNEALGQFAGRVAHDVLSPLSTAMLALQLVQRACAQDPSVHRATERGIAAVTRVRALVDGLLAFSRAGGQPEPGSSTEIAPVITDVVDALSGLASEQRIALCASAVPQGTIACTTGVLTSLCSNLVSNAIKYMADAPVRRIEVRTVDAGDRWRIEVADTGPGIPLEDQERIFQPYVQLGGNRSGIGLGLATVDRLVRGHGGTLGVISAPRRGSLFWFELPKGPPRAM
ncbi:MAG TPA: HAMP domain-containing sensor histidine kinase [Kofleriaceae bacterium]